MKQILLFLCSLILISNQNLQAQQNQSIQKQYAIYDSIQTQEKVYVQTDRTLYQPGNDIWLNAFVVNSANCPSDLSREVYVELLDPKGSVLSLKILENRNGCGEGEFQLPLDAVGGIYTLRAYSYWMQNFDAKHYFEKKLTVQKVVLPDVLMELDFEQEAYGAGSQVVATFKARTKDNKAFAEREINFDVLIEGKKLCSESVKTDAKGEAYLVFQLPSKLKTNQVLLNVQLNQDSIQESIARTVPLVLNNLDVQFLPEGGNLITNKVNRVAFKALNEYGKPVDIQAELLDENNTRLAIIESYHQGMGAFEFIPKENVSYQVRLLSPSGIQKEWTLPKVSNQTVGLYLQSQDKTQLVLDVYNNNQSLELVAQQQGKLFYTQNLSPKKGTQSVTILTQDLPMGVVQLTIFDSLKRALCERLVFVNKERQLSLDLQTNKTQYLPREVVELSLQARDETGKGVLGNFALAVVNDKEHTFIDDKQDNILSYLLMSSDLKGKVYEPNFYFDPTETKADAALDYVLLTHGWRRYNWSQVLEETPESWVDSIEFTIQSDEISGYVKFNRYLEGQQRILLSEKRPVYKKKKALMSTVTNADGFFKFKRKGLTFPVFLSFKHQGLPRTLKITEYSKAGLELIRKRDLKKAIPSKPKPTQTYTDIPLDHGQIYGVILDTGNDEGLPFANVVLQKEGVQIEGTQTDFDGNYSFDSIGAGTYDILVSYVGFPSVLTQGIPVRDKYKLEIDIEMTEDLNWNYNHLFSEEFILMDQKEAAQYQKRLTDNQKQQSTDCFIDGVRVIDSRPIPEIEIEEVQILRSGLSAAFENRQRISANGYLIEPGFSAGAYDRSAAYSMIVRSYRIPLIDQSNTMGGQTLSSSDIIPGGGWNTPSAGADYSSSPFVYDKVDFKQVGKGVSFSPNVEFYVPEYQAEEVVEVRTDFRKTIYWNPSVQTDENGTATIQYYNSDEVTTFRAIVEGGTATGLLGRTEHTYAVERPFSLTLRVPAVLSSWDTLEMPILLKNTSDQDIEGVLSIESPKALRLLDSLPSSIQLLKNSSRVIYVKSFVRNNIGIDQLKIAFKGNGLTDVVTQAIEVISKGFPNNFSLSGNEEILQDTFVLPDHYKGSLEAEFKIYSTLLDDLMGGAEGILSSPWGCFEQVSSANYPNILALQILKEKGNIRPEIKQKASNYLNIGYKKIVGYEIKGGGFEWYGRAPAHEGLTAYGLVQLNDMQAVYADLDPALLERTKAFLLSRRNGKGGYDQNVGKYGFSGDKKALFDTYITWALSEVGTKDIDLEVEKSVKEASKSQDLYRLSLACLTLFNLNEKEQAEVLLKDIIQQIKKEGIPNVRAESTVTYSYGNSLNIETLSFASLAMMHSSKVDVNLLGAIQRHIISKREYGRFGSTQSTVMALKMLLKYQDKYIKNEAEGQVNVYINDVLAQEHTYKKGVQGKRLFSSVNSYLKKGENILRIESEGTIRPSALEAKWMEVEPKSNLETPLTINTILQDNSTKVGEVVSMKVSLTNIEDKIQASPMAVIGIPAGLSLQIWQLKDLQEKGAFAYYEIKNNQLILYFRSMEAKEEKVFDFILKAEVAGKYKAPINSAYLYYNEERKYSGKGSEILIKKS
jgi:hypothetical protein